MLSKIALITLLFAASIRNSESVPADIHNCWDDNDVANTVRTVRTHSNGAIPILVINGDDNPMTDSLFKNFMDTTYEHLIIVYNAQNTCGITLKVLKIDPSIRQSILCMMKEGKLVKHLSHVVKWHSLYDKGIYNKIKTTTANYQPTANSLLFLDMLNQERDNQLILVEDQVGHPVTNPAVTYPSPNTVGSNPLYGVKFGHDQGQGSGQPRPQMNIQMTAPMDYQNFQMMRSSVSYQGQSSGQGQGSGQPRFPTNTQITTSMLNYPSFPITMPYESVPTMPTMSIPPTQQTLFKPTAEYAIPRGPDRTQNLLIRMENQEGRGNNLADSSHRRNNLAGSSHRRNNLNGSNLTLSGQQDLFDLNERPRQDGVPSRGSRSRSRTRSRSRSRS